MLSSILLTMFPLFFWNFSTPHPIWQMAVVVCNGFIQGMIYVYKQNLKFIIGKLKKEDNI